MTGLQKVAALIDKWNVGGEVSVADMINLTAEEREEFYTFLSPVNEQRLRAAVSKFING